MCSISQIYDRPYWVWSKKDPLEGGERFEELGVYLVSTVFCERKFPLKLRVMSDIVSPGSHHSHKYVEKESYYGAQNPPKALTGLTSDSWTTCKI